MKIESTAEHGVSMAFAGTGFIDFSKASGIWRTDVTVNSTVLKMYTDGGLTCWSNSSNWRLANWSFRHEQANFVTNQRVRACNFFSVSHDLWCTCVILSLCNPIPVRRDSDRTAQLNRKWRRTLKGNRRKAPQMDCRYSRKLCNNYGCKSVKCWS